MHGRRRPEQLPPHRLGAPVGLPAAAAVREVNAVVARRSYTASKPLSSVSTMSEGDRLITTNRRPGPHSTLLPQTTWACNGDWPPLTGDVTDDAFLDARGESMGFEDADRFPSEQFAPTALVGCACRILIDGLLEPSVPVRPPSTDGLVDAQIKPRFVTRHTRACAA